MDKKFLNANIINFAEVDKGGGQDAYPPKVNNSSVFFWNPSLSDKCETIVNHVFVFIAKTVKRSLLNQFMQNHSVCGEALALLGFANYIAWKFSDTHSGSFHFHHLGKWSRKSANFIEKG